jgi:hypothetical protein
MLLNNGKKKCDCGKIAIWVYMPGYSNGDNSYICDDCISTSDDIGCSCNWNYAKEQEGLPTDTPEGVEGIDWRWIEHEGDEYTDKITKEDDGYFQYLDERGRPHPCIEYDYDKDGFDNLTWLGRTISNISWKLFWFRRGLSVKFKAWWSKNVITKLPNDFEGF